MPMGFCLYVFFHSLEYRHRTTNRFSVSLMISHVTKSIIFWNIIQSCPSLATWISLVFDLWCHMLLISTKCWENISCHCYGLSQEKLILMQKYFYYPWPMRVLGYRALRGLSLCPSDRPSVGLSILPSLSLYSPQYLMDPVHIWYSHWP